MPVTPNHYASVATSIWSIFLHGVENVLNSETVPVLPSLIFHFNPLPTQDYPAEFFLSLRWLPCHFYLVIEQELLLLLHQKQIMCPSCIYFCTALRLFSTYRLLKLQCLFNIKVWCLFNVISSLCSVASTFLLHPSEPNYLCIFYLFLHSIDNWVIILYW